MTTTPITPRVPAGPVLLAGLGAQFVDDSAYLLIPPTALLAPFGGLLALLFTAGASWIVTRGRTGPAVARTGLAVGAVLAVIGLVAGGLGAAAILLAAPTVVAGVAGAVTRSGVAGPTGGRPRGAG